MSDDSAADRLREELYVGQDQPPGATLLLVPALSSAGGDACHALLQPEDPADCNLLCITYRETGDERLASWREHVGDAPGDVSILSATGSFDAGGGTGGVALAERDAVTAVDHPEDLTSLGIHFTERLEGWRDDDRRTVFCLDSVTAMLQYVELKTAFRFLDVVTGRLRSTGGLGHVHMDPEAHDPQSVSRVTQLFDAVVEVEDGEVSVRTNAP